MTATTPTGVDQISVSADGHLIGIGSHVHWQNIPYRVVRITRDGFGYARLILEPIGSGEIRLSYADDVFYELGGVKVPT